MSLLRNLLTAKMRPWDLLVTAGVTICVFSVTGWAGRTFWILDLTSHFRVQYAVLLTVLTFAFLVKGRFRLWSNHSTPVRSEDGPSHANRNSILAIFFAIFAALNWALVVPRCWGEIHRPDVAGATFKVMLLNVRRQNPDTAMAIRRIAEYDPDVVVLEEIDERCWTALSKTRATYPFQVSESREDDFGIAMLSKYPFDATTMNLRSAEVPSITAKVQVHGKDITMMATHPLPPAGAEGTRLRNEQLRAVADFFRGTAGTKILLGDLNTTPWNHAFKDLIKDSGLIDSSRGFGYQPTWPSFLWVSNASNSFSNDITQLCGCVPLMGMPKSWPARTFEVRTQPPM